ncbi:hypothetical protein M5689_002065 [Euphorbia peplus]|nr:hypothetical protein M5689_002065 [Euphorbia peplus]
MGSDFDKESTESGYNNDSMEGNFEEDYDSEMFKDKSIDEDSYDSHLEVILYHAEGIENPMIYPYIVHRIYKVECWVEFGSIYHSLQVHGLPNPHWNQTFYIPLENPDDCRFLHIEVIRSYSINDPSTSTNETIVGKVKIPLPKVSNRLEGRFGLVKPDGPSYKAEGHIVLALKLERME